MIKIFVLAKSKVEFDFFVRQQTLGFSRKDFIHLVDTNQLRGLLDLKVIVLEGFLAHGDEKFFDEVKEFVKYYEMIRSRHR